MTFTGYTQIAADTSDASDDDTRIYYRQADGTEGATDTLSTTNLVKLACLVQPVTGAADPATTAPTVSAATIGTGANINGTGVSGMASNDYLFVYLLALDGETQTSGTPSGYTMGVTPHSNSGTGGAAATNCMIWLATLQATAVTSEDPPAWGNTAPASGATTFLVAVPAPGGTTYTDTGFGVADADGYGVRTGGTPVAPAGPGPLLKRKKPHRFLTLR